MKKINKPRILQEDICDSIKDLQYNDRVVEKSLEYDKNIFNLKYFLNEEELFMRNNPDFKNHMLKMYSSRLSNSAESYANSYYYYRKLREQVRVCPYCNYFARSVSQLDHYLPKAIFPSFSITANNLVPICRDCNINKGGHSPESKSNVLLHPYYDDISEKILDFLKCEVIEDKNIGFIFKIKRLNDWDDETFNRVKIHFEMLGLEELYGTDFQANYSEFEYYMTELIKDNPSENIVRHLKIKTESSTNIVDKPWIYIGYKSILENKWFMNEYLFTRFY